MAEHLIPSDPVLGAALQANATAGLSAYDVTPNRALNVNQRLVKENTNVSGHNTSVGGNTPFQRSL
jgi:hypothetical protein